MRIFSPAALQRSGYLVGTLIRALAVAVACVFPNPASVVLAAAATTATTAATDAPAIETAEPASACERAGGAEAEGGAEPVSDLAPEGGDTAPESEGDEDDDNSGPLLSDDIAEHDDFLAGPVSGDPIRWYACGDERPAFGSRVPRPSVRA